MDHREKSFSTRCGSGMSTAAWRELIDNLDEIAKLALIRKRDARNLANLIYDVYAEDKAKRQNSSERL